MLSLLASLLLLSTGVASGQLLQFLGTTWNVTEWAWQSCKIISLESRIETISNFLLVSYCRWQIAVRHWWRIFQSAEPAGTSSHTLHR